MSQPADLVINARWVIPVEPANLTLEHHAVVIRDGTITDLLPQELARTRYHADRSISLPDHVLIPGLVNLHAHSPMALMRGIADDLPLMRWLQEAIWPAEGKHVSSTFVREGTLLAIAEMLRGGITTCNEMYFHPAAAAEAFDLLGMRAVIGLTTLEFPTPYASDADDYLRKGLAARDAWKNHPLIRFALAPHAPYTVSDATFVRIAALAAELDIPIHAHIHETAQEVADSIAQFGKRPLARLAGLDLLGENFIGVHAVHLDDSDIELLQRHQCSIAHCPTSNMKLASGIAPVARLQAAGILTGLGTDGAASNNRLDLFQELRHASLLAKVSTLDATALPAHAALRMATLNGARALGLGDRVGSIEAGKEADLCAIALDTFETRPCFNPTSHLVHVAGREHVSHVWVSGEIRVDKGNTVLQLNDTELLGFAALWQTKLSN
ncbi:TRZ/ATZ family hydrolase [Aromatoleum petrolei]|uniref:TRZ/ATZ family hydrolase n=1 Tax=Aromatoleum petrolei TaxID=76116 RepID=A0ABX1MZD8_9RHOO|nr:TRZ/ATZ family hydrolase [Aromatoleum petrolei]NMF90417.1 TRZ/ATZ family hydrolase [Aromatoleum petrolei]QTQ35689.1 5-methylthioadenosine/S-adenosylhomocysteine deaminase [Aromatoleum petrolei]